MAKEKRKYRLDKGSSGASSGEFLGFGAFAQARTLDPSLSSPSQLSIQWSPLYGGSDSRLSILFKKIGQKRDGGTKSKALLDVKEFFDDETQIKKEQVTALAHLVFVFHSRLVYDDFSSVRAAALSALDSARRRLPKVWKTLIERHKELSGMIWCAQADPSTEVKSTAQKLSKSLTVVDWPGVWEYVSRILGYSRPKVMFEDIFARKSGDETLVDAEREQLDERFERVFGTALSGLTLWFYNFPESDSFMYNSFITDRILWKPLTSARNSFRLKAYQLLGACCLHAKSIVYGPTDSYALTGLLPGIVAQEKDPTNVPYVFDVLLLYLTSGDSSGLDRGQLVKMINRMIKKACFGSSPSGWAPAILPLLASIDDNSLIISVISSLLEGCGATIGLSDSLTVASALAESACYFLIRSHADDLVDAEFSEALASYWCKTLGMFLCVQGVPPIAVEADLRLGVILGKTLCRLDEASFEKDKCGIHLKKDWFWIEELPMYLLANDDPEVNRRFNILLKRVAEHRRTTKQLSHLFPLVRRKFHSVLSKFNSTSGSVPSDESYELLQTCLEFNTAANTFASSGDFEQIGMEAFLLNDLLRWIIIHTSRLGTIGGHSLAIKQTMYDFSLLRICLLSVVPYDRQRVIWETVLREVVAAKCDFGVFALGLQELCLAPCEAGDTSLVVGVIRCDAFDKIAVQAVEDALQDSMITRSDTFEVFLRTCAGLCGTVRAPLVATAVCSKWVDIARSKEDDPVVGSILPVLFDLVSNQSLISFDDNVDVILMVWHKGGDLWFRNATTLLATPTFEELKTTFLDSAGAKLRLSLTALCDTFSEAGGDIVEQCRSWSERAARWFLVNDGLSVQEKLDGVGLADCRKWETAALSDRKVSDVLIRCTFGFLLGISNHAERFAALFGEVGCEDRIRLVALMMIAACDPNSRVRGSTAHERSCGAFVSLIGGRVMFNDDLANRCAGAIVQCLENSLLEGGSYQWARRSAVATSEFIDAMIQPYLSTHKDELGDSIDALSLRKGDEVWYVVNTGQDDVRDKAEIVEVHSPDFPRLFFTIRLEAGGVISERQTVAERLRSGKVSSRYSIRVSDVPPAELLFRKKLGVLLVDKVVRRTLTSNRDEKQHEIEIGAECFHIVLSQCGVFGRAGIGSLRYDLFQILLSLNSRVVRAIETRSLELAAFALRGLALALGVREQHVHSTFLLEYFQFDPESSLASLVSLYDSDELVDAMYQPTLMWTSVAFVSIGQSQLRKGVVQMICSVITSMTFDDDDDAFFAMRALSSVLRLPAGESSEVEEKAISKLIFLFALAGQVEHPLQGPCVACRWSEPFESLIDDVRRNKTSILRDASRENVHHLLRTLPLSSKRWISFRLLHLASKKSAPLNLNVEGNLLPHVTRSRLHHFQKNLMPDEAEELENFFLTVSEWVPPDLMAEMESWIEDDAYFDDPNEDTTIARLLGWLVFLEYLESSAAANARNRVAFSSYASRTGCVFFVLSACVMHLDVDFDRKSLKSSVSTIDDIIVNKESINATELSRTALFHTVEVFPTLSRGWWEEDCPKALSATVSKFVQQMVAPETFRRELERINEAMMLSATGEMIVKGSTVSREVTATYQQDECTLSIAIQIPPNFPFRSVDVDGRKTLGVSESRFKRWALQMRQIVNNQDGTLLDALMLWKRYVEKEFEGVEPCPVCYCVLAVKTHELPNMQCKTCANTFHSSCLQKWFTSSGKSRCVVCQQPWSGSRIS